MYMELYMELKCMYLTQEGFLKAKGHHRDPSANKNAGHLSTSKVYKIKVSMDRARAPFAITPHNICPQTLRREIA